MAKDTTPSDVTPARHALRTPRLPHDASWEKTQHDGQQLDDMDGIAEACPFCGELNPDEPVWELCDGILIARCFHCYTILDVFEDRGEDDG